MSSVDEGLLSKLIDKFGIEKEEIGPNKTRLWTKVTKEYNNITGNSHTKARLNKKWQNIKHQRNLKRKKLFECKPEQSEEVVEDNEGKEMGKSYNSFCDVSENIWNAMDHAFRDLLLYLVKKFSIDEVTNPRIKNELWKNISQEFHDTIDNIVIIKHEKFTKKWQNWKHYNKSKNLPNPLYDDTISLDIDVIKEKIRKLKERARIDPNFAAFLNRESDDIKYDNVTKKNIVTNSERPDRVVINSSSNLLSNKQLEREVYIEALRYEQENFRITVENGQIERDKLQRESKWMDIQLQLAQTELALKKQECHEKGIIIQS